jgi:hypothetical protein
MGQALCEADLPKAELMKAHLGLANLTNANLTEEIVFRAALGVVQSLAPYPGEQRIALRPSVARMLLA